ncbi:hypothetical protein BEH84_04770 [Eisenbergiella tayi]|uniref:Uncharacterized protein n=1 Tax=Eisenbergiella tayi TaxID=1432052 RepID=A0A1E3ANX5_9FIRM|nr:hypothetical protein BEH84_04770 [Eisenbergiella tayi]
MSQNHLADGLIIFLLAGIYNEHKKRRREWGEDMEGVMGRLVFMW